MLVFGIVLKRNIQSGMAMMSRERKRTLWLNTYRMP